MFDMLFLLSDWLLLFVVLMLRVKILKINIQSTVHIISKRCYLMLLVILMLFMDCSSDQYFELDFNSFIHAFININLCLF